MPVYIELLGVEPEDLKLNQRDGENRHDHVALANLVYGALKNREVAGADGPADQYYDTDHLAAELSDFSEEITGVSTVAAPSMHEKITGRRPDYGDD